MKKKLKDRVNDGKKFLKRMIRMIVEKGEEEET